MKLEALYKSLESLVADGSCGCSAQEYEWLYHQVLALPKTEGGIVVEIGSWRGASTVTLAAACDEMGYRLHTIDTWHLGKFEKQPLGPVRVLRKHAKPDDKWFDAFMDATEALIRSNLSRIVFQHVADASKMGQDVAFIAPVVMLWIDGGHQHPQCYEDWNNYAKYVMPGGMVAVHDVATDGQVRISLDAIEAEDGFVGWTEVEDMPKLNDPCAASPENPVHHRGRWTIKAWRRDGQE